MSEIKEKNYKNMTDKHDCVSTFSFTIDEASVMHRSFALCKKIPYACEIVLGCASGVANKVS